MTAFAGMEEATIEINRGVSALYESAAAASRTWHPRLVAQARMMFLIAFICISWVSGSARLAKACCANTEDHLR
jgi:hypothetical protein